MSNKQKSYLQKLANVLLFPLVPIILVIVLPFLFLFGTYHFFRGVYLRYSFGTKWRAENKFILFIYSDSPNWHDYIENNILPKLNPHVITLNWSKRAELEKNPTLESKVLKHWGGEKDYNPMAIIFPRFGRVKTVSFHQVSTVV